jgi:hypothetical protein
MKTEQHTRCAHAAPQKTAPGPVDKVLDKDIAPWLARLCILAFIAAVVCAVWDWRVWGVM